MQRVCAVGGEEGMIIIHSPLDSYGVKCKKNRQKLPKEIYLEVTSDSKEKGGFFKLPMLSKLGKGKNK